MTLKEFKFQGRKQIEVFFLFVWCFSNVFFRPTQWLIECYCLGTNRQSLIITKIRNQTQTKAKQRDKLIFKQKDKQTNRQTSRQTNTHTNRQTSRQTNKRTDKRKTNIQTDKAFYNQIDTEEQTNPQTYADKKTVSHVTTCFLFHDFHKRIFF